jgi:hypothetical protein
MAGVQLCPIDRLKANTGLQTMTNEAIMSETSMYFVQSCLASMSENLVPVK